MMNDRGEVMTNAEAIKWLELQRNVGIQWDDDSEKHRYFREEAEKRISEAYSMAIDALREHEPRATWHKWPDEKPEDYVDSTFPEGKGCWEITCLSLSRNGRVYLQKRTRFINRDPGNCHWSHWPDHGSAGWWMFIPKLPKEGDSE